MKFAGKVALVTGAGSGIGRATAMAFAREGAEVAVAGRRAEELAQTVKLIAGEGGRASAVVADVTAEDSVAAMVAATVERHGGLHVAFNNAGILRRPAPLAEVALEDWNAMLATNLTGVFLAMKHEIAHMVEHGGGAIVNTAANIGVHDRRPNLAAYAATKAGVSVLSRAAAKEYIGRGVRINVVSPGATDTAMSLRPGETPRARQERLSAVVPLGRVGTLDEVASAVLWLASDDAGFAVGHDLVVDGGVSA
jgi:NAD(P)-dependent dehydrogenase (short-subunit alcohol dehydrogenase family)